MDDTSEPTGLDDSADSFPPDVLPRDEVEAPVTAEGFVRHVVQIAEAQIEVARVKAPGMVGAWSRLWVDATQIARRLKPPVLDLTQAPPGAVPEGEPGRWLDLEWLCPRPGCSLGEHTRLVDAKWLAIHFTARVPEGALVDASVVRRICQTCPEPVNGLRLQCCRHDADLVPVEIVAVPRRGATS